MGVKVIAFDLLLRLKFDFVWSIEYLTGCGVASLLRVLLHDDCGKWEILVAPNSCLHLITI